MRTRFDARRYSYAFESLRELGTWIDSTPRNWTYEQSRKAPSQDWDLGAGYESAVNMARQGWLEGARVAQAALKVLAPKQPAPMERNDFYGYRPNVPRYCAGAPDCMVRKAPDMGAGQSLSLYVDVCISGATSAKAMSLYGVAIAHYIKQLELEGKGCEVSIGATVELHGKRQTFTCLIKRAGQPLDLAVLAFAVGHPACFRRLWFAFTERAKARQSMGYGRIRPLKLADCIDAPASAVVLHGMNNCKFRAPDEALEALKAEIQLKQKG